MHIRNSILAGELLAFLENVSGSVRIVDIEIVMQTTKKDIDFAIVRLLSEGLIELIKEDERVAIALTNKAKIGKNKYSDNSMARPFVSVRTA